MGSGRRTFGREAVWKAIRELKTFTVQDLNRVSGETVAAARDYVHGLCAAGFVEPAGTSDGPSGHPGAFKRAKFSLIKDQGVDAPRVRKDGTIVPEPGRDRMWRVMRILKEFSIRDLSVQSSLPEAPVAEGEAGFYCLYLARAGFLYEIEPNKRFRFLPSQYTGPRSPMIRRVREVIDANTGEVKWSGDAREDRP